MSGTALWAIQEAIYARLTGDVAYMGLVAGVFDEVPEGQRGPHVAIGEATETPFNTFDRDGSESTLTVHIWSEYRGNKEVLEILARQNELLDDHALAVTGHRTVLLQFENAPTMRDGNWRHVPARYRIVTQDGP